MMGTQQAADLLANIDNLPELEAAKEVRAAEKTAATKNRWGRGIGAVQADVAVRDAKTNVASMITMLLADPKAVAQSREETRREKFRKAAHSCGRKLRAMKRYREAQAFRQWRGFVRVHKAEAEAVAFAKWQRDARIAAQCRLDALGDGSSDAAAAEMEKRSGHAGVLPPRLVLPIHGPGAPTRKPAETGEIDPDEMVRQVGLYAERWRSAAARDIRVREDQRMIARAADGDYAAVRFALNGGASATAASPRTGETAVHRAGKWRRCRSRRCSPACARLTPPKRAMGTLK